MTAQNRDAVRAYLQRSEVRLSTMHRIGGAFLSGAGLLLLFPALLNNLFGQIMEVLPAARLSDQQIFLTVGILILMYIPFRAFFLLIRDIVLFYFIPNPPGVPQSSNYSRFILSGVAYSSDEAPSDKAAINASLSSDSMRRFLVPKRAPEEAHLDQILEKSPDFIEGFKETIWAKTANPALENVGPIELQDRRRLAAALRLAGSEDRTLLEETAKMELSLARHALHLRHLVLRYIKAFILFIYSTIFAVILTQAKPIGLIVGTEQTLVMAGTLWLWALLCPFFVTRPIKWITSRLSEGKAIHDRELMRFEIEVVLWTVAVYLIATVYLAAIPAWEPYVRTFYMGAGVLEIVNLWYFVMKDRGVPFSVGTLRRSREEIALADPQTVKRKLAEYIGAFLEVVVMCGITLLCLAVLPSYMRVWMGEMHPALLGAFSLIVPLIVLLSLPRLREVVLGLVAMILKK